MCQNLLSFFGSSFQRVKNGIHALQQGNGILVVDDENRENEGDLIFSALNINTKQMALLIRECSGIVCLCLTSEREHELNLTPMVSNNTSQYGTAFTISIEAAEGITTGVSASDRITTIKAATSPNASCKDLRHPGHIFPLVAKDNGVLERPGHTEASVDMMKLSGLPPYGVLCELTNPDGSMARLPEIVLFGQKYNFPVLSVKDIIEYRQYY